MRHRIPVQTIIIASVVLVAGCAQMQQQRQQAARQQMATEMRQRRVEAFADPAIDPVRGKITPDVKDITLAMRTNPDHVTTDEKPALEAFMSARKACNQAEAQFPQQPQLAAAYQGVLQRTDELIAALYAGHISFGEFNTTRIANVTEGGRERANIKQQINAQDQQRRAYQKAANCAAARAQVAQEEANGPANGKAAAFLQGVNQGLTIQQACN